jgi:hypothetical protein
MLLLPVLHDACQYAMRHDACQYMTPAVHVWLLPDGIKTESQDTLCQTDLILLLHHASSHMAGAFWFCDSTWTHQPGWMRVLL